MGSLENLTNAFSKVMQPGVDFKPWVTPGLVYVDPQDLTKFEETHPNLAGCKDRQTLISGILTYLSITRSLKQELVGVSLNAAIEDFRLTHDGTQLHARLRDRAETYYPGGYLFDGEGQAARKVLGIEPSSRPKSSRSRKRSLLRLGKVSGDISILTNPKLKELKILFGRYVELQHIDVVHEAE